RMVLAAEGRKANDSHADCYQYFCVPEYGTANGRLHFHAVHFMRTLPTGSVDPNFGRRVRNRRQLNSLQNTWRSEERRVGKECRSRWSPHHEKKNPVEPALAGEKVRSSEDCRWVALRQHLREVRGGPTRRHQSPHVVVGGVGELQQRRPAL